MGMTERPPAVSLSGFAGALACALVIGVCYLLAGRLGLTLLVQPEGVAVFWPASGLAGGALVVLGRKGILPVGIGVLLGTIAANLFGDRNLPLAVVFGCCNAGEALIFAFLVRNQPWSRKSDLFADLGSALWFFVAAAISAATMALIAASAILLLTASTAELTAIWSAWLASDAAGIIMLAPLIMALARARSEHLGRFELLEGVVLLGLLIAVTGFVFFQAPEAARLRVPLPLAILFPPLLWIAARCRPVFLAAGIAIAAFEIVWATTLGLGHFGDPGIDLRQRVFAAEVTLVAVAFCGLVLLAAFNQRRGVEAALRVNEERFQKLATAAPGLIYSFRADKAGHFSMPYASFAIKSVLGVDPEQVRTDAASIFASIHPDCAGRVSALIEASRSGFTQFQAEFRYRHPVRGEIWLEANSSPVREADGGTIWHGFLQDITQRKRAEARVAMLTGEVHHRSNNLLSVVQAVAFHTAREEKDGQFVDVFCKRIGGLAASHDLLVGSGWDGVTIGELAHSQLSHFDNFFGHRIMLAGPYIKLRPGAAQAIGMMLHELATNASKYGALAGEEGLVNVSWTADGVFRMSWQETGGPAPQQPARRGFGSRVLVEMAKHQLDASVNLDYPAHGVLWHIEAPLERIGDLQPSSNGSPNGSIVS